MSTPEQTSQPPVIDRAPILKTKEFYLALGLSVVSSALPYLQKVGFVASKAHALPPVADLVAEPIVMPEAPNARSAASRQRSPVEDPSAEEGCTSIRKKAKDIYMGYACASDGDKSMKIGGGYREKGWVYSLVAVGGIYKCGFVREGVLPELESANQTAANRCITYYPKLVEERFTYFKQYNCHAYPNGLDKCDSGTRKSEVQEEDCPDPIISRNFESDDPSPFNVLGTGEGGFEDPLSDEEHEFVSYRVEAKVSSSEGEPIVVRTLKRGPGLQWGLMNDECVSQDDRRGGSPTRE
jgi:hypothetical protein